MTPPPIKVSILEDDLEFQDWIKEELKEADNIECISCFDIAEDALVHLPTELPDILIIDLGLDKSDIGGIECMLRLNVVVPDLKFLVITANVNENTVFEALKVGAGAYIQKGDIPRRLSDLIQEFHAGGAPMSAGIARRVITSFRKPPEVLAQLEQLSDREMEILKLLAQGFLNKEIAYSLGIAIGTVKQHTHNIYKKLQVNNRAEAIRKYLDK